MTADYEKIRAENIARYGWDTAVLDLLGQLYSERTHFIFELIQNAEDAGAAEVAFDLFCDRLELRHDGRPFTEADVRGVCGVGQSGKSGDLTSIGKFGIGFKSVYAYTRTPRVYSGEEHFRIENFVRPVAEPPVAQAPAQTLFVFPFDHDGVPAEVAAREIAAALGALQPRILLFLRNVGRLRTGGPQAESSLLERSVAEGPVAEGPVAEGPVAEGPVAEGPVAEGPVSGRPGASRRVTVSRDGQREEWLAWPRPVEGHPGQRVEIAFLLAAGGGIAAVSGSPLTVFFPTEKETFLGFLIQGPYRTTPARDNVPGDDPSNQALVRQTAALLADVLPQLREEGLLTVDALQALPLSEARFGADSMFRPLFDATGDALTAQPLIPAAGGGYAVAVDLLLAGLPEVHDLLDPGQLGALSGAGRPVWFADAAISELATPALWRYLRDEIGLDEITPEAVVSLLTEDFLAAQSDQWIIRLYHFLAGHPSLWPVAAAQPVIRLEDGRQVAAVDPGGRPAVYLPGPAPSSLPAVKRAVADSPAARPFLAALQLAVPDLVAEALEIVLPRYRELDIAALDEARHDADLELVARALDEAAGARREELLDSVTVTPFLVGENAATGERALLPPPRLYQRSKDLETYFEGNRGAWFARDRYGPWLVQLRAMGVRQAVEVRARTPNAAGYVVITVDFGRNERGLDGFDPDAAVDGLDFALAHPSHARSEYAWNVLLAPNRRLVAGTVERSVLVSFSDSVVSMARSAMGEAAARQAWLPGRDGAFRSPGELSLDDLPPTYTRDEGLAQALGMLRPVVSEAARQLGVPAEVLWGLSERPDLVALVERELGQQPSP